MEYGKKIGMFMEAVSNAIRYDEYVTNEVSTTGFSEIRSCRIDGVEVDGDGSIQIDCEDGTEVCLSSWDSLETDESGMLFTFHFGDLLRVFDFSQVAA